MRIVTAKPPKKHLGRPVQRVEGVQKPEPERPRIVTTSRKTSTRFGPVQDIVVVLCASKGHHLLRSRNYSLAVRSYQQSPRAVAVKESRPMRTGGSWGIIPKKDGQHEAVRLPANAPLGMMPELPSWIARTRARVASADGSVAKLAA